MLSPVYSLDNSGPLVQNKLHWNVLRSSWLKVAQTEVCHHCSVRWCCFCCADIYGAAPRMLRVLFLWQPRRDKQFAASFVSVVIDLQSPGPGLKRRCSRNLGARGWETRWTPHRTWDRRGALVLVGPSPLLFLLFTSHVSSHPHSRSWVSFPLTFIS